MESIDILVSIPVSIRCHVHFPADLEDAYEQAEDEVKKVLAGLRNALQKYPSLKLEGADCMDMDYDKRTYDPYPREDPSKAVRDLGEWRYA